MVYNMILPTCFAPPDSGILFGLQILTADEPRPKTPTMPALYLQLNRTAKMNLYIGRYCNALDTDLLWLKTGTTGGIEMTEVTTANGVSITWPIHIVGVQSLVKNAAGTYTWQAVSPIFYYDGDRWTEVTLDDT